MSWAEVKKINSDMSTPLDIQSMLNHIDLIGSKYDATSNPVKTGNLLHIDSLYEHEIAAKSISYKIWDYILNYNSDHIGVDLNGFFGLDFADSVKTKNDLLGTPANTHKLAKSEMAMKTLFLTDSSYFSELLKNDGVIDGMLANNFAMNKIMELNETKFGSINIIRNTENAFNRIHSPSCLTLIDEVGSSTYVVPTNVIQITAVCISGGGAGGTAKLGDAPFNNVWGIGGYGGGSEHGIRGKGGSWVNNYGGGGGAGGYAMNTYVVRSGQHIPCYVGKGGVSQQAEGVSHDGETTLFNGLEGIPVSVRSQSVILPTLSTGGQYTEEYYVGVGNLGNGGNARGNRVGGGAGGIGGGDGLWGPGALPRYTGAGGKTYSETKGGGYGAGWNESNGGGGGYGGGGAGSQNGYDYPGGDGGQGCIALYLGRSEYIA